MSRDLAGGQLTLLMLTCHQISKLHTTGLSLARPALQWELGPIPRQFPYCCIRPHLGEHCKPDRAHGWDLACGQPGTAHLAQWKRLVTTQLGRILWIIEEIIHFVPTETFTYITWFSFVFNKVCSCPHHHRHAAGLVNSAQLATTAVNEYISPLMVVREEDQHCRQALDN